jgi:hypothetical protein
MQCECHNQLTRLNLLSLAIPSVSWQTDRLKSKSGLSISVLKPTST